MNTNSEQKYLMLPTDSPMILTLIVKLKQLAKLALVLTTEISSLEGSSHGSTGRGL
jgi:hypothetical protein